MRYQAVVTRNNVESEDAPPEIKRLRWIQRNWKSHPWLTSAAFVVFAIAAVPVLEWIANRTMLHGHEMTNDSVDAQIRLVRARMDALRHGQEDAQARLAGALVDHDAARLLRMVDTCATFLERLRVASDARRPSADTPEARSAWAQRFIDEPTLTTEEQKARCLRAEEGWQVRSSEYCTSSSYFTADIVKRTSQGEISVNRGPWAQFTTYSRTTIECQGALAQFLESRREMAWLRKQLVALEDESH
jgi:hypothetical protein